MSDATIDHDDALDQLQYHGQSVARFYEHFGQRESYSECKFFEYLGYQIKKETLK